jgi:hypothetical protein
MVHARDVHANDHAVRRAMSSAASTQSAHVVFETSLPLIGLERHAAAVDLGRLDTARVELLRAARSDAGSFRSGFLLGVQANPDTHPACLELARRLHKQMLSELEREQDLEFVLSFYKLAEGTPPPTDNEGPFYEGPHLDTHPELTETTELLRLLVNLSEYPRRFLYAASDRWQLQQQGLRHRRDDFEKLELPPGTETRVVVLPGRTGAAIHALKFLASAIPHVGLNDPPEHFLLSFEALIEVGT